MTSARQRLSDEYAALLNAEADTIAKVVLLLSGADASSVTSKNEVSRLVLELDSLLRTFTDSYKRRLMVAYSINEHVKLEFDLIKRGFNITEL